MKSLPIAHASLLGSLAVGSYRGAGLTSSAFYKTSTLGAANGSYVGYELKVCLLISYTIGCELFY